MTFSQFQLTLAVLVRVLRCCLPFYQDVFIAGNRLIEVCWLTVFLCYVWFIYAHLLATAKVILSLTAFFILQQIDIPKEEIFVSTSRNSPKPEEVGSLTPANAGSYHLFRFVHDFEGAKCSPVGK